MLSRLRKGLVYPVSTDITEHDLNTDVETWTYDDREVFRGNIDPEYLEKGLHVYWLYDDFNVRVGLAEHEKEDENLFCALWFKDTPFATLFQQDGWVCTNETLWSRMSGPAYEDCLRRKIQTPADLFHHYPAMKATIVTPGFLKQAETWCSACLSPTCKNCCVSREPVPPLFMDDEFVLYLPPSTPSPDDDHPPPPEQEQVQEQVLVPEQEFPL